MTKTNLLSFLILSIILSSCASSSITPAGRDIYMVSISQKGFNTGGEMKARAFIEANKFCSKDGKIMEPTSVSMQDMKVFRSDAFAEVIFKCSSK